MPRPQSTTSRQIFASLVAAAVLQKQFHCPQSIANTVSVHRTTGSLKILNVIAGEHNASPDAKVWRDGFCADCEDNETPLADARTFAEFLFDSG